MKYWISKYALTKGIFEAEGKVSELGYLYVKSLYGCICPANFHITREGAVAKAEQMRSRKITSLQKQIEKLKGLEF